MNDFRTPGQFAELYLVDCDYTREAEAAYAALYAEWERGQVENASLIGGWEEFRQALVTGLEGIRKFLLGEVDFAAAEKPIDDLMNLVAEMNKREGASHAD